MAKPAVKVKTKRVLHRCELCGLRTLFPDRHVNAPQCRVMQVAKSYEARGWDRCGHHSRTIKAHGVPVEYAPGAFWHALRPKKPIPNDPHQDTADVPFAPVWAVRICAWAASETKGDPTKRKAIRDYLLKRANEDEEFRATCDTVIALNGKVPDEWWDINGYWARRDARARDRGIRDLLGMETERASFLGLTETQKAELATLVGDLVKP